MHVRQHGGLEGFHTANNCTPDFTGAAASRPNGEFDPKTFPQINARTAFQLLTTPFPGVRYGKQRHWGGRYKGNLAVSEQDIRTVNEELFGMGLCGLREQRTCRVLKDLIDARCPSPYKPIPVRSASLLRAAQLHSTEPP